MKSLYAYFGLVASALGVAHAETSQSLREIVTAPVVVQQEEFHSVVPVQWWANKMFVRARVNGQPYQFIVDTGSPTLLTEKVARALDLPVLAQNIGVDANGNKVQTDVSVLDTLSIGDVTFERVPVYIMDTAGLEMGQNLLDGGIIGSEILPLAIWQFNFPDSEMIIGNRIDAFDFVDTAAKVELKTFGYPHMPIIEHEINGGLTDNALFDTGSTELLHINDLAVAELEKQGLLKTEPLQAFGSFGESGGGRGIDQRYQLVPISNVAIGGMEFSNIDVWSRPTPPTLVGARIFETHIVTLNYLGKTAHFHQYRHPEPQRRGFGFKPSYSDGAFRVGLLVESSAATNAGMSLHDRILEIDGETLTSFAEEDFKDRLSWLSTLDEEDSIDVVFVSNGEEKAVTLRQK